QVGGGITDADINVFGPIARSAADLDLLLGVLAGPVPEAAPAWRLALPDPKGASLADYRVGVWFDDDRCPLDREYLALLRSTVDALSGAGAKIEDAPPAVSFPEQHDLSSAMITAAIAPSMGPETGAAISGTHYDWLQRERDRARLRALWAEWFTAFDVLLCPV